ncbi:MAG: hypothetical protein RLZZ153_2261 [Pseudomonadota bacterium]|jgi:hypothetical protein
MSLSQAARLFEVLLGLSLCIQTLEHLRIVRLDRVSSWAAQRTELPAWPAWLRPFLDALLSSTSRYAGLLIAQLCLALALMAGQIALAGSLALFACALLLLFRWRGAFNGGSDFMTLVALSGLLLGHILALIFDSQLGWRAALWYVALQSLSSYFVSGWVKLMHPGWRSGAALPVFLNTGVYGPLPLSSPFRHPLVARICAWAFTIWEGLFPLALLDVRLAVLFCAVAALFHGLVFWFFGLNRFFWAWLATFPAILYVASS